MAHGSQTTYHAANAGGVAAFKVQLDQTPPTTTQPLIHFFPNTRPIHLPSSLHTLQIPLTRHSCSALSPVTRETQHDMQSAAATV